jgi:hypothetical protein
MERSGRYAPSLIQIILIQKISLLYAFVTGYGPVQGVDNSGELRVFPITLGLQTCIHKEFNFCFFFVGLVNNVLFSLLNMIPIRFKGNIMKHVSAKHKLTG